MTHVQKDSDGIRLHLWIQPRSAQNKIIGVYQDKLKIALTAPPLENRANESCILFLSKALQIKRSDLTIVHGEKNRYKVVKIYGDSTLLSKKVSELL